MSSLEIKNLHVSIGEKEIVKVSHLTIPQRRDPRHHGAQRHRQVDLSKAIAGPPGLPRSPAGEVLLDGVSILGAGGRRARARGHFPRVPIPERDPGRFHRQLSPRRPAGARMAEGEELDASAYYKRLYSKMDC